MSSFGARREMRDSHQVRPTCWLPRALTALPECPARGPSTLTHFGVARDELRQYLGNAAKEGHTLTFELNPTVLRKIGASRVNGDAQVNQRVGAVEVHAGKYRVTVAGNVREERPLRDSGNQVE
ncbi:hypothetical protein DFH09DRAFT_1077313 [Mycena vulgaris]|nr:hypothetical protein DFH09DRAFT_1077313 [Mycena vulgaris]